VDFSDAGVATLEERRHGMTVFFWLEQLLSDLRFGIRNLVKNPGFAIIAAGSLALGIGASTAMYSVIYAVLLDPFPYKDVDHLATISIREPGKRGSFGYYSTDQYLEFAERSTIFDGVIASTVSDVVWTGTGDPLRLRGNYCSMNTFSVMGVAPLIGRGTLPSDQSPSAEPIAILGYKFWQRQFAGDPGVIGRKLRLNDKIRTVVGVMPQRFMWRGADVYLPVVFHRGEIVEQVHDVHVVGRVKPGVTEARAEADLRPIVEEMQRRDPNSFPKQWRVGIRSFKETFPSGIREALWILFGAVGLLLLIACVNLSNLLLAKAASRRREVAVRASLGASRLRLIRQFLAESLVLAVAGGLLGILIAYAGLKGIIAMVPPDTIPDEAKIEMNLAVLLFTIAVSIAAAIISGLAPALHVSGRDVATPLKETGRSLSGGKRQKMLPAGLVIGEVALSLMLLVGASLMIRTLFAMEHLNLGIRADHLLTMRIPANQGHVPDERRIAFWADLLRQVQVLPGVTAAAVNTGFHPFGGWWFPIEVPGNSQSDDRPVQVDQTDESYTKTMGIGLAEGRFFTANEVANRAHVAVVNRAFVRRYSAGREAIGRPVRIPEFRQAPASLANDSFEIVGVVNDAINDIRNSDTMPEMYIPYTILGLADYLVVATVGPPTSLTSAVRRQVYQLDKNQPVTDVGSVEAMLREYAYSRPRFNLLLFAIFGGLGLVLALAGVYGVMSNLVAQRTPEIGLRIALGAHFHQVTGMILGAGAKLVGAGILLGLIGSLLSVRVLSSQVSTLSTFDPLSFIAVAALLLFAGLLASFWPARRAARVDPITALRHE
jgi:putative ABC transport system permease protein